MKSISKSSKVRPIDWHEKCYACSLASLERKKREAERLQETITQLSDELNRYRTQIDRAIAEDREGFDPERYGKEKRK